LHCFKEESEDEGERQISHRPSCPPVFENLNTHDVVSILVVTPANHHVRQTASWLVDSERGGVDGVSGIGVRRDWKKKKKANDQRDQKK